MTLFAHSKISMSTLKQSKKTKEVAQTKAYYEKYAHEWAKSHANSFYHEKEFIYLKELLKPNASIIDIGCAGGVHVPLFLGIGRGLKYHGIDITKKFVALASHRYPQLTFTEADISIQETLPRKKFDGFLALAVLMHLPFTLWDAAFGNIEKMVRSGGYGYVVLPENRPPLTVDSTDTRHFTLLSEKEQIAFMKKRGWKIVKKFNHTVGQNKAQWVGYIVKLP